MRGYFAIAMGSLGLAALVYGWVWWFRVGRRQAQVRKGKAITTLICSTLLPIVIAPLYPYCSLPESKVAGFSFALIPFIAIAMMLAFWLPKPIRWLFVAYPLLWFGWWVASLPIAPRPCG